MKVFYTFVRFQEFKVDLLKSPGGGLGFTVVGGVSTTGGCYVKAVVQDPALSDGRLHPGDRLIQVSNTARHSAERDINIFDRT